MTGSRITRRSTTTRLAAAITMVLAFAIACAPPSELPGRHGRPDPPVGVNGMTTEAGAPGGDVWAADLMGSQLLRFDADSGRIAERYGPFEGLCATDDLVVAPGGDLIATCPFTGNVIRVTRGGRAQVLAHVGDGVNPIELDPSGDAVLVGFGTDAHDELLRVPLTGGAVEVVADDLPVLNGFALGPDDRLYVPTGGAGGILGTGGLGVIDLATGNFEQIALSFADGSPSRLRLRLRDRRGNRRDRDRRPVRQPVAVGGGPVHRRRVAHRALAAACCRQRDDPRRRPRAALGIPGIEGRGVHPCRRRHLGPIGHQRRRLIPVEP
ncbi:MAG: hypothetical protein M5U19_18920 [Microthrixaceae bacterium]|nr:hypothetical protein [Microthrixaceae bacterium]